MPETAAQRDDRRRRAAEVAVMRFDGLDSVRLMRHRQGASGHRSVPLSGGKWSTNGRGKTGVRYYEHGVEIPAEIGRASLVAQLERHARDVGLSAAALRSSSASTSADPPVAASCPRAFWMHDRSAAVGRDGHHPAGGRNELTTTT